MNHRVIEIKQLRGECRVVEVEPDHAVYIADISESQVVIKGKCMKVVAIDVQKSMIAVHSVAVTVEVARAKASLFVLGGCPMAVLEQCVECRIGVVGKKAEMRLRRCASLSLVRLEGVNMEKETPESLDEMCRSKKEEHLPDEMQILLEEGAVKSSIVKNG
ncbi:hypothetical protein NERG_02699 [Nematocida ausubeli]|uniref:Adenylate cyclase-associated CAP C-terminal domain-containing protein n=1 Tax=Nematocida ausubeli (strain ATCC PRA-371 / ERTm2) TaxID=1913371 RepID=H8ZGH8_NEMA1|nr:hypothetical protein NERG_02699 [Nematocida ausubeli]